MSTWKESFLKILSSSDMTLYLMQAAGSDPSTHPDLISSTMLSIGVPFQNPAFAGTATALPNRARAINNTLLDTILRICAPGVHWLKVERFVIVSTRTLLFLYRYFKFSTWCPVPVRIVSSFGRLTTFWHEQPGKALIRILFDASDWKRLMF